MLLSFTVATLAAALGSKLFSSNSEQETEQEYSASLENKDLYQNKTKSPLQSWNKKNTFFSRVLGRGENSVKISFITASNESHIEILNQLRNMNDANTNLLFDQNDIEFYYTNDYRVKYKTHYLIRRLELESETDKIINNTNRID